jgi:FkbM family methyltransferase
MILYLGCLKSTKYILMISYAQNFEDVMLWRALKHVKNGFYIDIGANDPIEDSVTKWFYENGWSGINIEPLTVHFKDLIKDRPRDINLNLALGESSGFLDLWITDTRGWATADLETVDIHKKSGHEGKFISVEKKTLSQIFREFVKNDIHFMKIDVEGFEKQVLKGADLKKNRPWIIIIEATKPNSNIESYKEWDYLIEPFDYSCIYFDGLNRFYIAKEHIDLAVNFKSPPNVFDKFIQWPSQVKIIELQESKEQIKELEAKAKESEAKAKESEAKELEAKAKLNTIYISRSWRITDPLRQLSRQVRLLRQDGLKARIKALTKKAIKHLLPLVVARPTLLALATRLADLLGLADCLKPFVADLANLTPRARLIHADLKASYRKPK